MLNQEPSLARLALILLATANLAAAPRASQQEPVALRKLRVSVPGDSFQSVHADLKGHVSVITQQLEVYDLVGTSRLRLRGQLKTTSGEPMAPPFGSALSADGSTWLLRSTSGKAYLFDDEKGVPLPNPPLPLEVLAFAGSDPVAGSVLARDLLLFLREGDRSEPPFLWRLDGSDWEPFLRLEKKRRGELAEDAMSLQSTVLAAEDVRGRLWIAEQFTYSIRRLSPSGKEELAVSDPRFSTLPIATAEQEKSLTDQLDKKGVQAARVSSMVAVPPPLIEALTVWSRDAYLVAATPGGYSLDRIDGTTGEVSRIALEIEHPELIRTIAASEDGIVFGLARANQGLYFVDWLTLEPKWVAVAETDTRRSEEAAESTAE